MRQGTRYLIFLLMLLIAGMASAQEPNPDIDQWPQVKGVHFVVVYSQASDETAAQEILRKAEEYYNSLTDLIGYARYKNFWTWDERVKIVYFPDQAAFAAMTGQPPWSKGFSISHLNAFNLRMIVSFHGQDDFLTSILPHEIGHLVLHDFMGAGQSVPLWFDEGVAQFYEENNNADSRGIVARLVASGKVFSLADLANNNMRQDSDEMKAAIFYAETLYIVDFLVKTYGKDAFRELCRSLRDGRSFEDALKAAYYPTIESLKALDDKWTAHMRTFL